MRSFSFHDNIINGTYAMNAKKTEKARERNYETDKRTQIIWYLLVWPLYDSDNSDKYVILRA